MVNGSRWAREDALLKRLFARHGLLRARTFSFLLLASALVPPLLVFREPYSTPFAAIPAARPAPHHDHGDPLIALSVMGRAWNRWDSRDFSQHDDRVFAPYPDAWALGESLTAPALIGYLPARLTGSEAFGYNVSHYVSCVVAVLGAGYLFSGLAGRGWAAILGALVFGWCPGRLNDLGLVQTLWAGFVPLGLGFVTRFLRHGRAKHLAGVFATWLVLGLGSLYSMVMGTTFLGMFLLLVVLWDKGYARRATLTGIFVLAASALLVAFYSPLFDVKEAFEASVSIQTIEGYSGDLLSVAHQGVFSGPLRTFLDRLAPGFPEGAAALFPTLFAVSSLALYALAGRVRGPRRPWVGRRLGPWAVLAAAMFLFCLGPVIHFAGRSLCPGPYSLLVRLPVFESMRGVNRWDQFFALALLAAATMGLGVALRTPSASKVRLILSMSILLTLLDVWPRRVPGIFVPAPSVFDREIEAMPKDSIVAYYPFKWSTSVRSWTEQLTHGRRVLNGYQTFPPPIHRWVASVADSRGVGEILAVYRELGVSAVEIDFDELPPNKRSEAAALLQRPEDLQGGRVRITGNRALVTWTPRVPVLVDPSVLKDLVFVGGVAVLAHHPGRLIFRLRSSRTPVRIRTASGEYEDVLTIPVVSAGTAVARLGTPLPSDGSVRDLRSDRKIGDPGSP